LLARTAAIKLMRPAVLDDRMRDRFEREAQATAALTSPHTIRLFDFGVSDEGAFYYVMELLDGRDLETLVREFGPLPPSRALHFIGHACSSLAEAHAAGLVHRDIKPANIYACRMGLEYDFAKVLDFGLVKQEQPSDAPTLVTNNELTIGTPAYMAPEVILGDGTADRRVDIYALGCVAYFLVTGERVFDATSPMKLLMDHVQTEPCPPSRRADQHIPRDFDDLVMACLNKDPDRRPRTAEELSAMAGACKAANMWDQKAARAWWKTNLPEFTPGAPSAAPACGDRKKNEKSQQPATTFKKFRSCQPSRGPFDRPSSTWPARSEPAIAFCRS
jgi:serine/threonine-protein kinase